jgi:capsid protein
VRHYFDAERVLQTRGVPHMAPVLQDVRDFSAFKDATLWRARMEACIGFLIKKNLPTAGGGASPGLGRTPGRHRADGQRDAHADMVPGMVPELMPGEDVDPFIPSSPGNQYDPFTTITLRGIGAGMGMSFGALTRHNDANYSAARQDMLEDEREIGPQQDA